MLLKYTALLYLFQINCCSSKNVKCITSCARLWKNDKVSYSQHNYLIIIKNIVYENVTIYDIKSINTNHRTIDSFRTQCELLFFFSASQAPTSHRASWTTSSQPTFSSMKICLSVSLCGVSACFIWWAVGSIRLLLHRNGLSSASLEHPLSKERCHNRHWQW